MTSQLFFFIFLGVIAAGIIAGVIWLSRHDSADRGGHGRHD